MTRPDGVWDLDVNELSLPARDALVSLLFQIADDELILGHRDSEWLGIAPELEEDVAFSSIAQDEVGHASFFYGLLEDIGQGTADALAYGRAAAVRRNAVLVELDNGDFANTIVRHVLYDVFDNVRLQFLTGSCWLPLAQGARKILREEYYHLRHFETWFTRLGAAGGEAQSRMVDSIQRLWSYVPSLFEMPSGAQVLYEVGIHTWSTEAALATWNGRMSELFRQAHLDWPGDILPVGSSAHGPGRTQHTMSLSELLKTMSEVYEMEPTGLW